MLDVLPSMVRGLREARGFEAAAPVALRPMVDAAGAALEASAFAGKGAIVRAVVHLRGDDAYRAVAVYDVETPADAAERRFESTTTWRWIERDGEPVEIDVLLGRAHTVSDPETPLASGGALSSATFGGAATRQDLLSRGTTHVLVLPLRDGAGELAGMVSIEAICRAAMGRRFPWDGALDALGTLADVAGPVLSAKPVAGDGGAAPIDPLLPVCGPTMQPIVKLLRLFAAQEETVLLLGPTGSGKSRLARFCHAQSPRAGGPFETVDLLSVPPDVQAGELFGWKRGAFTGAVAAHEGSVARAKGGTLFIDEIDKLSLGAQASLLQLLETRRYRALGDAAGEKTADVRFVVGTNADLVQEVRDGRFREDLYYRIHVLAVKVPPLDARRDELADWARYMLERRQVESGARGSVALSAAAEATLLARRWPGNLRQLDNVLRRAHVLAAAEAGGADVAVDAPHLGRSLETESTSLGDDRGGVVARLTDTAERLVEAARRRADDGAQGDLDDALVLRAFVLGAALRRAEGDVEAAFRWLGREKLVTSRNHHKTMERELERARAFCEAAGEPIPAWLVEALGGTPGPGAT